MQGRATREGEEVMHHVFRHKRYKVLRARSYECGKCNFTDRTVALNPEVNGRLALDTAIHEGVHACYPDMDEPAVTEAATDIAKFLWRLGYRRKGERDAT